MTGFARATALLAALLALGGCGMTYRYQPPPRLAVKQDVKDLFLFQRNGLAHPDPLDVPVPDVTATGDESLGLDDVLSSVETFFPELLAALQEIDLAEAQLLKAQGAFDTKLGAGAKVKTGYYDQRNLSVGVVEPIEELGGAIFGGWRRNTGNIADYDGDLDTNQGGEFSLGANMPVLRGRTVDPRRVGVWKARIQQDAADPLIHRKRIDIIRKATFLYWKWVAAGRKVGVARSLLALARDRQESLRSAVEEGQFGEIILTDNERLVVERESLVVAATRDLERSALALSLYYRGDGGVPIVMTPGRIPPAFPEPPSLPDDSLQDHVKVGLRQRPEIRILHAQRAAAALDLELGENDLLPRLDALALAAQDVGRSNSKSLDPFELSLGVKFELPLQRRKARGDVLASRAKIAKISQAARLQADRVEQEVRDAASAWSRSLERRSLAARAVVLAQRMEEAERDLLEEGASDLLRVNLREQSTAKARSNFIELEALCLSAVAAYRAALGLPAAASPIEYEESVP